jgi:hypothetical protein
VPVEAELTSADTSPTALVDRDAGDQATDGPGERTSAPTGEGRRRVRLLTTMTVLVVVSPIVVAALALVGESWVPMSDWSSLVYRVSEVGTAQTPLVGPYSFHGFAHPGPLLYWVSAPLYRLTGEDPRAVLWTGALVNLLAVAGLAAVAWRRGRWALLLGTTVLVGLLVHGLEPRVTVDMWNPYVALLPFLLAAFLVWDAALGRRRALLEAAVVASFTAQAHLAFLFLVVMLLGWLAAWTFWSRKTGGPAWADGAAGDAWAGGPGGTADGGEVANVADADGSQVSWTRLGRRLAVVLGLLWLGPLLDAVGDLHNPVNVARSIGAEGMPTIGLVDAVPLVGRHVRLDGLWVVGGDPPSFPSVGSATDSLHLVVTLLLVGACVYVGRQRRLADVVALATLTATLLVGSVPAASQLVAPPTPAYLTAWIKVVGGLAWFTVAWTGWRLAEPAVRAVPARSRVAATVAAITLVGATAWSWPDASRTAPPYNDGAASIRAVRAELDRVLARDRVYRVEVPGDRTTHFTGLIYWLIHDGFQVVTSDGAKGLKWGHDHRWSPGDPYDAVLTVVVHTPWDPVEPGEDCHDDPRVRQVLAYDGLTENQRRWLDDVAWRSLGDPDSISDSENRRAQRLTNRNVQLHVFEGPVVCGT